jgi:hypothetical protein
VKQLTILCSSDLSDTVRDVLVRVGITGFLKVPHAVGSKPGATWQHGRYPTWDAEMFVAAAEAETVDKVVEELEQHAGECDVEPCLRIMVSALEAVY